MPIRLALLAAAAVLSLSAASAQNSASDYPNKPVKLVVANPAGGGVDTVSRIVAEKLHQKLGQPFVIENRGGAGGNLGAEAVYSAAPDGYTLMTSAPSPITANVFLHKKLNFVPSKLEPVALLGSYPNVLLVRNDFPARTVQEFVAYVKANPGKVNFASQGIGTTSHLTAEWFQTLTGSKMVHVPYRGTAPALNDIIAGHVDFIFMQLSSSLRLHEGKKARILAVATAKRVDALKDTPTMIEAGVPNFISDTWNALTAPPGTPPAITTKLNQAINALFDDPETKEQLARIEVVATGGTPAELRTLIDDETRRWGEVIKRSGIEPE